MEQLLAHLLGDYVIQNHWMANTKTKSSLAAAIHALTYGLPFFLLVSNPLQWAVIVGTHFVIDRWRLASYWVDFWGTGKPGWLPTQIERRLFPLDPPEGTERYGGVRTRMPPAAPPWLAVWLLFIVDNTMHMCINFAALKWL